VCHGKTHRLHIGRRCPNCTTDEGGPLGTGLQEQVPNYRELLRSRVVEKDNESPPFTKDRGGTRRKVSEMMFRRVRMAERKRRGLRMAAGKI